MTIQAKIERFFPDTARALLSGMTANRNLKIAKVDIFASAIKQGSFNSLNGETIIINQSGRLEDGQHRLTAFLESGAPYIDFLVVRGVKEGAGQTVDQGTNRSPADIASMIGFEHPRMLMSSARWLWIYENNWPNGLCRADHVQAKILIELIRENPQLISAVDDVLRNFNTVTRIMTESVAGFVRLVTDRASSYKSDIFFNALNTGEFAPESRQIRHLRDKLLARKSKTGRLRGGEIIVLTARTWNAFMEGRDLSRLYVTKSDDGTFRTAPRFK